MSNLMENAVVKGLERGPNVVVPEDFAARVMSALPEVKPARVRRPVARWVAAVMMAAVAVALFVLAPRAVPSVTNLAFDVEMVLLAQLAGMGWFVARRG